MLRLGRHRLETGRLILRRPERRDVPEIARLANHREISEKLGTMPYPYREQDASEFLDRIDEVGDRASVFAVCLKERGAGPGTLIGMCGYGPAHGLPKDSDPETDFGYWLGIDFWGKGYATEAADAVLTHAFCLSMVDAVTTDFQKTNPASGRVLEKLGFRVIGERTRHSLGSGAWVETFNVRLTSDGWLARKRINVA